MSTEKSLDLNMLLRHCSWMIMVFLIFGIRDLYEILFRNARFYSKYAILFMKPLNFDSNDHQHTIKYDFIVSWEEPRLKRLLRHYSLDELWDFWFVGMWDFIHDVRFYSEMQDFIHENPRSLTQIITEHNEKCIVSYCTTAAATIKYVSRGILALKYCRYIAFWMIMGFLCIWNVRFYSKSWPKRDLISIIFGL